MKGVAILLILVALALYAFRPPGMYDSKARHEAHRRYRDFPSEQNRIALEQVKRSEAREINICSALAVALFGTGIFLLVRPKKDVPKHVVVQ